MTTATEINLKRVYTQEEQDALFDAYIQAIDDGDDEARQHIAAQMPLEPDWAKCIFKVMGREFLEEHFNLTEANRVFGERWMDG